MSAEHAGSYEIVVVTSNGQTDPADIELMSVITSVSPTSGPAGTLLTVSGLGLETPVQIGGIDCVTVTESTTEVTCTVVSQAGNTTVTTGGASTDFEVTASAAATCTISNDLSPSGARSATISCDGPISAIFVDNVAESFDSTGNDAVISGSVQRPLGSYSILVLTDSGLFSGSINVAAAVSSE